MARSLAILAVLTLCVVGTIAADTSFTQFMDFVNRFEKNYETIEELEYRFTVFQQNMERVQALRDSHFKETGEPGDFTYGVTKFSDLTPEEFKGRYLSFRPSPEVFQAHATTPVLRPLSNIHLANNTKWDWRPLGAITPVKDQAQCGSCWAFSTAEEIESMWYLANHTLPTLSPQQIVSCDTVDQGCNGGDTVSAYAYVQKAGGLESEKSYPYTSGGGDSGTCKFKSADIVAKISGFKYATPPCQDACDKQDEVTLAQNLAAVGPVSICVYAESWQFYTSGILKSSCPKAYDQLDHCVQLVGYNEEGTTPYWIVRNSWNTDWGIQGYIWIEMGKNLCGVADEATIVSI